MAQKTDVLYMLNGDKITGEIKSLDFGKLKFKTDHASTIYVDWEDIETFKSDAVFAINLADGQRLFGSIDTSGTKGFVVLHEVMGSKKLDMQFIVLMNPIKNTFWSRIDGNIEAGISYTKATDILQINGAFNAEYKGKNFLTGYRSSNIQTIQTNEKDQKKYDINLYIIRMYNKNWFAQIKASGESNSELGLEWRTLYGGTAGHDFVRSVYSRFSGGVGVYFNGEKGVDSSAFTSSIEGLVSLSYKVVRYDVPKVDIYTAFNLFPSFTESGRVRIQYDLNTKFEIIADLYFSINFYYTFDNVPRTVGAAKDDYGVLGSIGYKF